MATAAPARLPVINGPTPSDELKRLQEEAADRLADCKRQKDGVRSDIEECYALAAPRRRRAAQVASGDDSASRPGDRSENTTSLAKELTADFAEIVIDSFTPQSAKWAERKLEPDGEIDEITAEAFNEEVAEEDEKIFKLIRGSNYYAEKAKAAVPDLAIGVIGMLIEDRGRGDPIVCQGIPLREIEMNVGPDGRIDDRWIVRQTKYRFVRTLLKGVALPREVEERIRDKPHAQVELRWGWWRDWDDGSSESWQHVVFVDDKLVHARKVIGAGSCPFVIGRFGASPDYAWPDGPLLQALEDFRYLNEIRLGKIEYIDFTLRPPKAYEDDGTINFGDAGIEPGMAYPKRPNGGRPSFESIYEPQSIEAVLFEEQQIVETIRRLLYVDRPEQRGKTPPSATQWLDEMVLKQRRIGQPGYSYWREEPFETFQRFRYLGEARGVVRKLQAPNGAPLHPYNPAQRAQENQDVLTASRFLQIALSAFPQEAQLAIDGPTTMRNLQKKLGDKIVAFRTGEAIKQTAELLAPLVGGAGLGARIPGGLIGGGSGQ